MHAIATNTRLMLTAVATYNRSMLQQLVYLELKMFILNEKEFIVSSEPTTCKLKMYVEMFKYTHESPCKLSLSLYILPTWACTMVACIVLFHFQYTCISFRRQVYIVIVSCVYFPCPYIFLKLMVPCMIYITFHLTFY